jgi:BatD DUF11 like domain
MSIMTGKPSQMYRSLLRHSLLVRTTIASFAFATLVGSANAEEPSVTAVLTSSETAVGQPVQLQIQVKGDRNAAAPAQISVDGLEIQSTGQMQSFEMRNFNVSSSVTFSYTILPQRAGRFIIPPQTIRAGSTSLRTPELALNVSDSQNQPSRSNRAPAVADPRKSTFAELIVPKTTAYVGEMIPIVVRVGFELQTRVRNIAQEIDLPGQGFTKQKMRASEARQTIGEKTYNIITYKTAIAAARTGTIEIGPVEIPAVVLVPQSQRNRPIPQNPLGMNDPALEDFFNDPWLMGSVPREIKLTTERVNIEVKALPPHAPPTFNGAVGNFTMTSDANPKTVQLGDPITVTAKISGRGNFDRVTAPSFEDERGWHKYPPSADFKQDDDVGISGTKTFETVLSPNERKDKIPVQLFTFFDSIKGEYVTLRGDPIPVRVEGGSAPAAPAPATTAGTAPALAASPPTAPKQRDILYQLTELPTAPQSFAPLFARRSFAFAQLFPLLTLLGFVAWRMRQAHLDNREARRREALQHEATELQRSLRREDTSTQEYFSRASRAVQVKTALARNVDPNMVDAELAASAFHADEATRLRLRHLFEKSDEVRYSGSGQNGTRVVPLETRNDVLDLIESLRV